MNKSWKSFFCTSFYQPREKEREVKKREEIIRGKRREREERKGIKEREEKPFFFFTITINERVSLERMKIDSLEKIILRTILFSFKILEKKRKREKEKERKREREKKGKPGD